MNADVSHFDAWMDEFLDQYYKFRPVNATFIGNHQYDHQLPDFSDAGVSDCVNGMATLLNRLHALPAEDLTTHQSIDRTLAEGFLRIQQWEFDSQHFQCANPSLYVGEAVFGILSLFLTEYAPIRARTEAAIERMRAIPAFLSQAQQNLTQAPRGWTERAIDECDGGLALFNTGIKLLMQSERIEDRGFESAAEGASAAVAQFRSFLEHDLLSNATDEYACGEEAFNLLMRYGHFIDTPTAELVSHAENTIAEAESYLNQHASDFGASSVDDALAQLADHHPSAGEYYASYDQVWQACRALAVKQKLITWPDFPIEYVPRPEWTRSAARHLYFLFYRSPAAFNRPPVHRYLVNPLDETASPEEQEAFLRNNNNSVIKLNHVVHHGSIGHHVQNWNAFHSPSRIGQIAAVDCASRIAMFCAGTMAEGWSCYATDLMNEAGFLTRLESYAEVQSRRRMAARTVVDVKLHTGEFSLEEAADFYQRTASMPPSAAHGEAVKNSMFPGAAMMYLSGMDYIRDLRRELSAIQGDDFNLADFHDEFLSYGSIPVTLVGAEMRKNLAERK